MKNVQGTLRRQAGLEISETNETLVKEITIPPNDLKKKAAHDKRT